MKCKQSLLWGIHQKIREGAMCVHRSIFWLKEQVQRLKRGVCRCRNGEKARVAEMGTVVVLDWCVCVSVYTHMFMCTHMHLQCFP